MLFFHIATNSDTDLLYQWANDPLVRSNSYNQKPILYDEHVKWFQSVLSSGNCIIYIFHNETQQAVGQVRISRGEKETTIGISIDDAFRGKSLGSQMLIMATENYLSKYPGESITAYIKEHNISSYKIFVKAGFKDEQKILEHNIPSVKLTKRLK